MARLVLILSLHVIIRLEPRKKAGTQRFLLEGRQDMQARQRGGGQGTLGGSGCRQIELAPWGGQDAAKSNWHPGGVRMPPNRIGTLGVGTNSPQNSYPSQTSHCYASRRR